jgi:hypothetical protein
MLRIVRTLIVVALAAATLTLAAPTHAADPRTRAAAALRVAPQLLAAHTITTVDAAQGMGPEGVTAWEAPRVCGEWFVSSINHRLSYCINNYFVQDVVKAHAKLHLYYRPCPTCSYITAPAAKSLTVNNWSLTTQRGEFIRSPVSAGGSSIRDFYSAGIGIDCPPDDFAISEIFDESFRANDQFGGGAYLGPGGSAEYRRTGIDQRPC